MKYLSKTFKLVSFFVALSISLTTFAQLPERPNPPKLVNDLAGMLQPNERANLEQELVNFDNQTTNQIAIVTIKDLGGQDISSYAINLATKWSIGNKGKNNGILILIKPKNETKGGVFIATGYGLESVVPDALAKRIVQVEIIPKFVKGDYFGGISAATKTLMSLTKGEFTADQYYAKHNKKKSNNSAYLFFAIVALIALIAISSARSKRNNQYRNGSAVTEGLPWWLLLTMMGSGNRGGSFGDFSSGSGGFGGGNSDNDFGGFGGGDFGGGGAGGSW